MRREAPKPLPDRRESKPVTVRQATLGTKASSSLMLKTDNSSGTRGQRAASTRREREGSARARVHVHVRCVRASVREHRALQRAGSARDRVHARLNSKINHNKTTKRMKRNTGNWDIHDTCKRASVTYAGAHANHFTETQVLLCFCPTQSARSPTGTTPLARTKGGHNWRSPELPKTWRPGRPSLARQNVLHEAAPRLKKKAARDFPHL